MRKGVVFFVLVCLVAAGLSASGKAEGGAEQSGKPLDGVELNWATFLNSGVSQSDLEALIDVWEEETGATMSLSIYPSQEIASNVTVDESAGVHSFDAFTMNFPFIGQFAEAEQLIHLDPYINDSEARDADIDGFIPRLLEVYGRWNGNTYAFPLSADGRVFAYRTDIVEEADLPETWDEYIDFAEKYNGQDLNGDGTPDYGLSIRIAGDTIAAGRFLEVFNGLGGTLLGDDWMPHIDSKYGIEAIETFLELKQFAPPETLSFNYGDYNGTYWAGRVPALIMWNSAASITLDPEQSTVADKTAFALVPGRKPLLGGWALAGLSSSDTPDAVYDFMAWFTSADTEEMRWSDGNNLYPPTRISTLTNPDLNETRPFWPVLMENFKTSEALPRIPEAPELVQVLGQAVQRALSEELSPEAALSEAQDKWETILRDAGRLQ